VTAWLARQPVGGVGDSLSRGLEEAVDLLLPRRCVSCGAAGAWLCGACAARLEPLTGPRCRRCGRPTQVPARGCIECRGRDLSFVDAVAAFSYDGPARDLVKACKFRRLRSLAQEMAALAAPRFAQLCAAAGQHESFALATWVPTTQGRRLERGFDQAELFARQLAGHARLSVAPLLARTRAADKQSELNRGARAGNVRGAFRCTQPACGSGEMGGGVVPVRAGAAHGGRQTRVLIIDDVYTTGETLNECAIALCAAGYEPHVFTFARTVRGHRA
jgi:predicted amidophosphoribosyltransferase